METRYQIRTPVNDVRSVQIPSSTRIHIKGRIETAQLDIHKTPRLAAETLEDRTSGFRNMD
jgi:hypothetical protein